MIEVFWAGPLVVFVILGLGLVALSAQLRFSQRMFSKTMDEAASDYWRFCFFIAWTLFLPLVWLLEWYGYFGLYKHWQSMPKPMPEFTYGRKVISDLWTAVAAVLGLLAWNKKP